MRKQLGRFSLADICLDHSQRCIISSNGKIKAFQMANYKLPQTPGKQSELSPKLPVDALHLSL